MAGSDDESQQFEDEGTDDAMRLLTEMVSCQRLLLLENRISTFKSWPFPADSSCHATKMAEAGWYHAPTSNEPDLVKCCVCFKEMEGWEEGDDPVVEHKRSPDCEFLKLYHSLRKRSFTESDITVEEFLGLVRSRNKQAVAKSATKLSMELETMADNLVEEIKLKR